IAAAQRAKFIHAAEELVRATFPDNLGVLGDDLGERIGGLQKGFREYVHLAGRQFQSLESEIGLWQLQVFQGEKDFDPNHEAEFKQALLALTSFANVLREKFDAYH